MPAPLEKRRIAGKAEGSRKGGRPNMRCMDSMREAMTLNVHDLSKAVNKRRTLENFSSQGRRK